MNHALSNSWQKIMYSDLSAAFLLDSQENHKLARKEVSFLISALGLKKKQSVLDIPCGTGRYALVFAQKGFSVEGIDINDACLKIAKKNCQGMKNVQIKKGDMRKLLWAKGKFDIILNMFTSFGYFQTDRGNTQILKGFFQALKPGGKLIVQTINKNWILSRFSPFSWEETPHLHIITKRKFSKTNYLEATQAFLYKKSKKWETSCHRIRLYSIPEMKTLMKKVGFKKIKILKEPPSKTSQIPHRPIYVAEVPK